jgi:ligand-binding sensor domain-containing protein
METKNLFWFSKIVFTKAVFLFAILSCITAGITSAQQYPYKFHYLTVDEGLSHTDANDIAQDKQGYIWVATYFGLDRFDGYSVKRFYNNNVPLNNAFKNRIKSIYPDKNGNIWLGTEGGLQCFNSKLEKYIDFDEPKKSDRPDFQKLVKPDGDLIYVFTGDRLKIFLISGNNIEEQKVDTPHDVRFSDMMADHNGVLYLTSNKGLWMLDKSNQLKSLTITGLPDESLSRILFDNRNNPMLSAENKIFQVIKKQGANGTVLAVNRQFIVLM